VPDDTFEGDREEQETTPSGGNQSKAFERITQERDQLRAERDELRAKVVAGEKASAFDELKIDRKYTELYSGEVDAEAIKSWATKFGFVGSFDAPAEPETGAPEAPAPPAAEETQPPVQVGSPPVVGGQRAYEGKISPGEYHLMVRAGKLEEAAKAVAEGRVELLSGGRFAPNPNTVTSTPIDRGEKQG
jgi:hypothetical protein